MFDRNRQHGTVSGPGVAGASFYQDGHYYDVAARYLFSDPNRAAPPGVKAVRTLEEAEALFQTGQIADAVVAASAPSVGTPAASTEPPAGGLTREQELNQLGYPQLANLHLNALKMLHPDKDESELKKQLIRGAGSKAKTIAWLLENTTA
jgi:hypothetical protein